MKRMQELLDIMARLRDPQRGCPWDLKQDFRSIAPHTLEECYEVVDAIERGDHGQLRNELGDLLFQVVFYAQMASEQGLFDFGDVCAEIRDKLLYRHPHIFPDGTVESFGSESTLSPAQVERNWEILKQRERELRKALQAPGEDAPDSVLDDVPRALPSLSRAAKLQRRAATVGFDWTDVRGVLDKLKEEILELEQAMERREEQETADELGDVLFTVVNLARHLKQDAETSLRHASGKFERRFRRMEARIAEAGRQMTELGSDELDAHWRAVKADEGSHS